MQTAIDMGLGPQGASALLDLEELLATRLLVQGNSGSGKSHLLRRLLEQSAPYVQQVVIDPEGDFVTLSDRFGHVVVDANQSEADLQRIALRVRQHRVSIILNLESLDVEAQMRRAAAFLGGLFDADRSVWFPALVVVDEAQLFAPAVAGEVSDEARRLSLGAMTNLMCRGRKRGLAGIIATQRLAKLAKNVAAEASNFLMGRTFLDIDMARAADLLGLERRQAEAFRDLERGCFMALGPALSRRPVTIRIGSVETASRGTSPSLLPLPEQALDARDLIMTPLAGEDARVAQIGAPPVPKVSASDVLVQLSSYRPVPESEPVVEHVDPAERAAIIDAVLADIVADPDAAGRTDAVLYQDFTVRCRMRRVQGAEVSLAEFRRRLAKAKAGIDVGSTGLPGWETIEAQAAALPEDLQGVFYFLARAALGQETTPSDEDIARVYGTSSVSRARRLLTFLEERGVIVCRTDFRGCRIIALPSVGAETAPGEPVGIARRLGR